MRNFHISMMMIVLCIWVLNGCATGLTKDQKIKAGMNEALVFGRITLLNVKHQAGGKVFVKEEGREMATSYPLSDDGLFCWKLKPGKYNIISFQFKQGWGRIWVDFEVPANEKHIYVGRLNIKAAVISEFTVTDNYSFDVDAVVDKFGLGEQEITTRLMTKEEI